MSISQHFYVLMLRLYLMPGSANEDAAESCWEEVRVEAAGNLDAPSEARVGPTLTLFSDNRARRPILMQEATWGRLALGSKAIACRTKVVAPAGMGHCFKRVQRAHGGAVANTCTSGYQIQKLSAPVEGKEALKG